MFLIITGFMSLATYFITTGVVSSEYAKTTLSEDLAHFRTESYKLVNRYCTGSSPATAEFCHQLRANMDLKTDRVAEPIKAELLKDSAKIAGSALGAVVSSARLDPTPIPADRHLFNRLDSSVCYPDCLCARGEVCGAETARREGQRRRGEEGRCHGAESLSSLELYDRE